jgi:hypothetical protein
MTVTAAWPESAIPARPRVHTIRAPIAGSHDPAIRQIARIISPDKSESTVLLILIGFPKWTEDEQGFRGDGAPGQVGILASRVPQTYTLVVARGWESKSIEAQQSEAAEPSRTSGRRITPEEAVNLRERESLRLARQRVLEQIEASRNPRHRKLLEMSLAELDERLRKPK